MKISIFTNGWRRRSTTVSCGLLIMIFLTGLNAYAKKSTPPDMALLEFIGEGVKVGKDIVDPLSWQAMQDMTAKRQDNKQQHKQKQNDGQKRNGRQDHD